jgi:hypothetical protein
MKPLHSADSKHDTSPAMPAFAKFVGFPGFLHWKDLLHPSADQPLIDKAGDFRQVASEAAIGWPRDGDADPHHASAALAVRSVFVRLWDSGIRNRAQRFSLIPCVWQSIRGRQPNRVSL